MDSKELIKKGKFLSLVLRHKPEEIGIKLDNQGWVYVSELLDRLNSHNIKLSFDELKYIVESNNKKRYSFNDDFTKIRASQGHSLDLEIEFKEEIPPDFLYHGTAEKNFESIIKDGINKGKRHHVHLSSNIETAINVGSRHGKPIVLKVKSKQMYQEGIKFFISENNVWLTDFVSSEFIEKI